MELATRIIGWAVIGLLLASALCAALHTSPLEAVVATDASTKILIHPSQRMEETFYTNETFPGQSLIVNATVVNVTDLENWQIALNWNPSMLALSYTRLPSDHVFSGSSAAMVTPPPVARPGYVMWGCTFIQTHSPWTFNGTGTLCQIGFTMQPTQNPPPITFNITFALTDGFYQDTFLLDRASHEIPFTVEDGEYTLAAVSDVAVTNITPERTVIGQDYPEIVGMNVTVLNEDYYLPTSTNLTVYVNSTVLDKAQNISLPPRGSTITTFAWNTSKLPKGNYTVTAVADVVENETHTSDNTRNQIVIITIAGDVTSVSGWPDGIVDMRDIGAICGKFGTKPSSSNWDPDMDINDDGIVNMRDVGIACSNFGKQ